MFIAALFIYICIYTYQYCTYISKKNSPLKRYMDPMFIESLFIIAQIQKQPKYLQTDKQIKKMWYIYTMEYYSFIKKDEIFPFATIWVDLKGIMISEISQRKKNTI